MIHVAINRNFIKGLRILIHFNCDLNVKNYQSLSPLELAYENDNIQAFKILLKCGIEPKVANYTERNQANELNTILNKVQNIWKSKEDK